MPLLPAAGVFTAVLALYVLTLSPSAAMWDAGEYIAAAKALGIPHHPGNPMYLLIAHVAGMLPVASEYAVRINLLAAFCGALTAAIWYVVAMRLLRDRIAAMWMRVAVSVTAALLGATAFTVWNQSVVMEKVYPIALVGLALSSWIVLRWIDTPDERHADRLLLLVAYIAGVTYAVHPAGLLTAPAVAAAVAAYRPRHLLRWKLLAGLAGLFVFGASAFAVLPIRAAHQPFVNENQVSACEDGRFELSCTFSEETGRRLIGAINREQYGGHSVLDRRAPFVAQLQMYWQYFRWQWLRDPTASLGALQSVVAVMMLLLGLAGLWTMRGRAGAADRDAPARGGRASPASRSVANAQFWYFTTLTFTFTLALIYYLNFRYGWSQSPELGSLVPREPRDRDYFFMWTFSLWGLLAGTGLGALLARVASRAIRPAEIRLAGAVGVLALAVIVAMPVIANAESASRAGQRFTSKWAADMLRSVEPNGVLITHGDNDSFPLWYAQEVEGIRRDVVVTLVPYLGMEWYARQMNLRHGLWDLSDEQLDQVPPYVENPGRSSFSHGDISTTITAPFLTRDQLLVLRAIKDSFPERGIFFSFGPYAEELGLGDYVKRVGLVQKLEPRPVTEGPDTVRLEGGWIDVTRSLELWEQYEAARQVVAEGKWVDVASRDIPLFYAYVGNDLATALDQQGRRAEADSVIALARSVVEAVR